MYLNDKELENYNDNIDYLVGVIDRQSRIVKATLDIIMDYEEKGYEVNKNPIVRDIRNLISSHLNLEVEYNRKRIEVKNKNDH